MKRMRSLLTALTAMSAQRELSKSVRRLTLGMVKGTMSGAISEDFSALADTIRIAQTELSAWIEPETIDAGRGGPFDSCDLRIWLKVAERAGVGLVPARTILSLHEDELALVLPSVKIPDMARRKMERSLRQAAARGDVQPPFEDDAGMRSFLADVDAVAGMIGINARRSRRDPETILAQSYEALDGLPENCMVRSHISGGAILKTFAGAGVISSATDTGMISADLEVGPGWVRNGNRRRIDLSDDRIVSNFARGHKDTIHFLARPWVEAARRNICEDPLRHGTPFAGIGSWPCEWRVFVTNGRVTGVSSYYGWAGGVTPLDARRALEAAALAERMLETMRDLSLVPRFMDIEIHRAQAARDPKATHPGIVVMLDRLPRDGISCTLDFLETRDQGLVFLEAGPPHTEIGGGHCCSFAGHGTRRETGIYSSCEGVALRLIDGVSLGDPETWFDRSPEGAVLSWEEARQLAQLDLDPDEPDGP